MFSVVGNMDDQERLINILPNYYRKLYPYDLIAEWLTYGKGIEYMYMNIEYMYMIFYVNL